MSMGNRLVWMDLEMSGLDVERERILEIAVLVTEADLSVVAEGIESSKTREMLEQLGCTFAQGFEFGSPMSAARLSAFLRSLREVDYLMLTA